MAIARTQDILEGLGRSATLLLEEEFGLTGARFRHQYCLPGTSRFDYMFRIDLGNYAADFGLTEEDLLDPKKAFDEAVIPAVQALARMHWSTTPADPERASRAVAAMDALGL